MARVRVWTDNEYRVRRNPPLHFRRCTCAAALAAGDAPPEPSFESSLNKLRVGSAELAPMEAARAAERSSLAIMPEKY